MGSKDVETCIELLAVCPTKYVPKIGQTNSRAYPILDALYISHILLADYVLGIDLLTNTEPIELDNKLFSY